MKQVLFVFLLMPALVQAQLRVYTVAGCDTCLHLNDGGKATEGYVNATEGIWLDGSCNLYISQSSSCIRKVNLNTGIITTIAGTEGRRGYSGDGGPATNAQICLYGLWADHVGNVYFPDPNNNRVRRVDAMTGIITTIAGTGVAGYNGDGIPATNAQLNQPGYIFGDTLGNIYVGEQGQEHAPSSRIRKINRRGIISTIAGTGANGYSGDGGPATSAQLFAPAGMLFDAVGNLFFADRGNSVIRKIDTHGIITTYAGSTDGYSGDGGPATRAQLSGPISFVIDYMGNMVIGDNQNNYLRKVDAYTGIITTIAGMGPSGAGSDSEGVSATTAGIHPEFMCLDRSGNIYFSCWMCNKVRKVTPYYPSLPTTTHDCGETSVPALTNANSDGIKLFPNPATNELTITSPLRISSVSICNLLGIVINAHVFDAQQAHVDVADLPAGIYLVRINDTDVRKFVKQ